MESTGIIQYADSPISGGKTRGLLSIFTDVSSAVPNSGGQMFPRDFTGISSYGYRINTGAYSGGYSINRNDSVGETIWGIINTTGEWRLGYFYDYVHWPTDNRFIPVWDNNMSPMDDMRFVVECNSQIVLNTVVNAATIYDPSGGVPYTMATGAGSTGAFVASNVSTDWTGTITISNLTQMMGFNVMYRIYDYTTGLDIITGNMALNPPGWTDTISWTQPYPSIMGITLQTM